MNTSSALSSRRSCTHLGPKFHDPNTLAGNTPVLWISEPFSSPDTEFFGPSSKPITPTALKTGPALYMVERARERGDLKPGAMIVESTSGTLGSRLALAGISYRHHGAPAVFRPGIAHRDTTAQRLPAQLTSVPKEGSREPSRSPAFWNTFPV